VNSDSFFEKRIDLLLRWKKRRRLFLFLVWFVAFFLILNSLALGFEEVFQFEPDPLYLYWVLTLVSFGMALGFHLLTKRKLLSDLIEMDSRLRLKDRLSTAFEYLRSGRKSQFRERLLTGAGRVLEELPKNKLYPPRFSAAYVLIPSLALIMTGLSLFYFSPPKPTGEKTKERLVRVGRTIERFSKEKIRQTGGLNDQSLGEPYRRLEEIAKDLQNKSLNQEKLLLALGEMKKEALAERLRLTRKLEKELYADSPPGPGQPFSLPQEMTTKEDLEKMTEQLKDLFEEGLPESIARDISRIGEKMELEQFLDKTISQAVPSEPGGDQRSLQAKRERGYADGGESREKLDQQPSGETRSLLAPEKERAMLPGSPKAGQGLEDGRKTGNKPQGGREGDDRFTAGTTKGTGERYLPFELKGEKGPSFKEGGGPPGSEPGSSFQARALPYFGKTKNGQEEIRQEIPPSYRREMEAALLKEKIPREYRDTIKNYFLSIRPEKGKKQDDKSL
jgi:hypothetical protein